MILPNTPQDTPAVASHYDELDRWYRELWGEHVHHGLWSEPGLAQPEAVRALVRLVAERAGVGRGDAVCDIGCGYGATARQLAEEYGASTLGLTVSRAQFEHACAASEDGNPRFLLRDWLENDLPAGSHDVVVAIESLSHVGDKAGFFREIRRVLRPGGTGVVCAWLAGEHARGWQVRHLLEPICREGRLAGLGSAGEYVELLGGAGFEAIEFEDLTGLVKKTWSICAARCFRRFARDSEFRRYVRSGPRSREFARGVLRIWAAYELGAMKYGLFRFRNA